MNTFDEAVRRISSYLESDDKFLLISGTHQYEKHILALRLVFNSYKSPTTVLFRSNSMQSLKGRNFLGRLFNSRINFKTGTPYRIRGGYTLFVDSINRRTWNSSPQDIDVGIIYPIDSLNFNNGDDCVQDLIDRNAKKIILITWTDNKDFSWVNQYNPCHVVYDAEEENPEYHQRVKEIELKHPRLSQQIKRLPQYAKSTPGNYLIQIHCDKCRCSRWARLNKPYPGKTALGNAELGEFSAACLMCGYEAWDSYNWSR